MPAKPWVTFQRPDPQHEYLALLSELRLKRLRSLGRFILYTFQIQTQLRKTPGLVGYSLMAHVFRKRFWTLSVWEDEGALGKFVGQLPHGRIMAALRGEMEQTRFTQWQIPGSDYPLRWPEVLQKRGAP